ncbi:MAG TPA: quinone-dependent dihydroorotate dehydrogenase [Verrucomicrobiae bacterium]|nr:quinone-dependent dihydroorotate dehydrogenase [Verrucomicrobiae bacterium]
MIYGLAREALFALDAERSHELTLGVLSRFPKLATAPFAGRVPDSPAELLGLRFRNRVGLAAGLDKNGDCIEAFDRLGFGFIEIGTVTPRPQPGNPRPRLFRLPRQQALINRLGFNNHGVDHLVERVRRTPCQAVLGINIGKNADTPVENAADDYERCLRKVYAVAGYVTINISSPNTKNLRDLQETQRLTALLERLLRTREELAQRQGRVVPLLVKIAPDLELAALRELALKARELGVDGLIATNTTIARPGLDGVPNASETGGLSGAPLRGRAVEAVRALRDAVGGDYPLIGVGGIGSGEDARDRRRAGADLVQIYTGFIYRGPELVGECARALLASQGSARVR